jgi:hypothetical protein
MPPRSAGMACCAWTNADGQAAKVPRLIAKSLRLIIGLLR